MNDEQFIGLIKFMVTELGSQKEFARTFKLSEQFVSDVVNGRRKPTARLAKALGYRRVYLYERIAAPAAEGETK